MTPQDPNTNHTINLTNSKHVGKQNPYKTRRTRRPQQDVRQLSRPEAERILVLAEFLPVSDALVLRELLGAGRTVAHVSRLLGVSRHRVRSRVDRLLLRMRDPAFRYVIARRLRFGRDTDPRRGEQASARLTWPEEWSEPMRIAAQMCVMDGHSCRDAAALAKVSFHVLRRHVSVLRELGQVWRESREGREAA